MPPCRGQRHRDAMQRTPTDPALAASACASHLQSAREQPWSTSRAVWAAARPRLRRPPTGDPGTATCTISARPAVPFTRPADLPVYHSHARDRPRCCMGLPPGKPCSIALLQYTFARAPHSTVWLRAGRTSFCGKKEAQSLSPLTTPVMALHQAIQTATRVSPTRDLSAHVIEAPDACLTPRRLAQHRPITISSHVERTSLLC